VRNLIREVAWFAPYEKRISELLKLGKDKRVLKVAKRKLGTHRRAKMKSKEMSNVFRKMRIVLCTFVSIVMLDIKFIMISISGMCAFFCY